MRNLKVTIQYNGSNYCGWQKQPDSLGIQGTIEKAIHDITREEVKLTGLVGLMQVFIRRTSC